MTRRGGVGYYRVMDRTHGSAYASQDDRYLAGAAPRAATRRMRLALTPPRGA